MGPNVATPAVQCTDTYRAHPLPVPYGPKVIHVVMISRFEIGTAGKVDLKEVSEEARKFILETYGPQDSDDIIKKFRKNKLSKAFQHGSGSLDQGSLKQWESH